ncbi:MAG: acylphosphatase [Calditrichota bacterium]
MNPDPINTADASLARAQIIVRGIVQGVGFRWFVKDAADNLTLTGTVKNLTNGDVEVRAEGPRDLLKQLVIILQTGNRHSLVESCHVLWETYRGEYRSFRIIH